MITNLEIVDDETAKAFGQKFDVPRVIEASIAFLRGFIADIVAAAPHVRPMIRFTADRGRAQALDDDGYARLRNEFLSLARLWDVVNHAVSVDIGTIQVKLRLLGRDDLQRYGGAEPVLITEADWRDLDPTPMMDFLPVFGMPIFEARAHRLAKELILRHAPSGTKPQLDGIPSLRFPHHAFGAGLGDLRINLLTIPIDP